LSPAIKGLEGPFGTRGAQHSTVKNERWAAQTFHGIMAIHRAGVLNGDLRCRNIVIDSHHTQGESILPIVKGSRKDGVRFGMNLMDPRCDVYSFGVTLWEIVNNGDGAESHGSALESAVTGQIIRDCVVDHANLRPSLNDMVNAPTGRNSRMMQLRNAALVTK